MTESIVKSFLIGGFVLLCLCFTGGCADENSNVSSFNKIILPDVVFSNDSSLEAALLERRSVREYSNKSFTKEDLSSILFSADGITDAETGLRTAPSAMKKYPITLYVIANNVDEIERGIYSYNPVDNSIEKKFDEAKMNEVIESLQKQTVYAPVTFLMVGNYSAFSDMMKDEVEVVRHVALEAGHIGQNILLYGTSKGMAGVPYTGFDAGKVGDLLELADENNVLYAVSVGFKA